MKIVIIPATYNEAENIEKFIITLEEEVLPKIKGHDLSILVADDYSPDGTGDIVKKLMKKYKNLGINEGEKKGLGAAYLRAMGHAIDKQGADLVISIDADFQFNPHDLPKFVQKIDQGYDLVIQSRYSGGGSIPQNWPIQRKLFSITANLFVRTIFMRFSIHDWTGGFRAIKKDVFKKTAPEMKGYNGYIFQIAFLHKAVQKGFRVGEVPLHFTDRKLGMSKIAPLGYIINVLSYVFKARIIEITTGSFGKFLVVGGTGFIINLVLYSLLVHSTSIKLAFANQIAAQFAIFSNFNLNNLWTFKASRAKSKSSYLLKLGQFLLTSNIGVIIFQGGVIHFGEEMYGRKFPLPFVYFVIGTGFLLVYNFSIYRFFIWRKIHHHTN